MGLVVSFVECLDSLEDDSRNRRDDHNNQREQDLGVRQLHVLLDICYAEFVFWAFRPQQLEVCLFFCQIIRQLYVCHPLLAIAVVDTTIDLLVCNSGL